MASSADATADAADQLAGMSLGASDPGAPKATHGMRMGRFAMAVEDDDDVFCSNCGKTGTSDEFKGCNGCRCIRYCSASCQKAHWKTHKKECKRIQAVLKNGPANEGASVDLSQAPTTDNTGLFDDPPPRPDCDICMIRRQLDPSMTTYVPCCGKKICSTCSFEQEKATHDSKSPSCPFCRAPCHPTDIEECLERAEKRAAMDDPNAFWMLAMTYHNGELGLPVDDEKALKYAQRAVDLGDVDALYGLGRAYHHGHLGLEIDKVKGRKYWEMAAKRGHAIARHNLGDLERRDANTAHNLGDLERRDGNTAKAIRHLRIAAAGGYTPSLGALIECFEIGYIGHEDLVPCFRARDKALLEVKSESRERYIEYLKAKGQFEDVIGTGGW